MGECVRARARVRAWCVCEWRSHKAIEASNSAIVIIQRQFHEHHLLSERPRVNARQGKYARARQGGAMRRALTTMTITTTTITVAAKITSADSAWGTGGFAAAVFRIAIS